LGGKLPQRHQWFAGVGILDDEVTAVAGQRPVFNRPLRARTDADHFVDVNKMVGDLVAAVRAGFARLGDDGGEIAEGRFISTGSSARKILTKR
jgi:hypothetical protein